MPLSHVMYGGIMSVALLVGFSTSCNAQYLPKQAQARAVVRLANEERKNIQLKTILANPKLVSARSSCEVTSFVISFKPEYGEPYGPVRVEGNSMQAEQIKYLKSMPDANVKIVIEHIHMSCNGKDEVEEPITVTSFP